MSLQNWLPPTAVVVAALWCAGCQTYERRPLNLSEHDSQWRSRSPETDSVAEFARALNEQADRPAVFDPADGISVYEGECIALVFNAELRLARARAKVASATAENAGLWEDPVFEIDVLRITESVSNPWVVSAGLGLTIPVSGRLKVERDRAAAALQSALYRVAASEWDVRMDVRRLWAQWSATHLRIEETRSLLQSLDALVRSTHQMAEAGELLRTEAALFSIERLQRQAERARLEGASQQLELQLREILGLAPDAPVRFVAALSVVQGPGSNGDDAATQNLELAQLRAKYDESEQTLRREIHKQYPDVTLGPAYEDDEGQSKIGFLGALPIPILNANKQGIAEAMAARELARAEVETTYERIRSRLQAVRAQLDTLAVQRNTIESQVIPAVDAQLRDSRRLLELGETGTLVLLESLTRAHGTKLQLIDLRLELAQAETELQRLLGPARGLDAQDEAHRSEVNE